MESVVHISSGDAGTPIRPFDSKDAKKLVIYWLLGHSGVDVSSASRDIPMGRGEVYNEVVIQPHRKNKIVGVFYREKALRPIAERLAKRLEEVTGRKIEVEYVPIQSKGDFKEASQAFDFGSMLGALKALLSTKGHVLLHHPQGIYSIGIR